MDSVMAPKKKFGKRPWFLFFFFATLALFVGSFFIPWLIRKVKPEGAE